MAPSIVLVHGGFVDGSGWEGVYGILKNAGYSLGVVQNPTISLAGDVAATKQMSNRAGSKTAEVGGSHAIYVSNPKVVADIIIKAAREVGA